LSEGTIESLARTIETWQQPRRHSPLVRIRPHGSRPPLFLCHGIGGEVLSFEALTRHLDPALPIYGLQGEGINFPKGQTLNIESMASQYLEAIREVQPRGPYFLTGYSAGGITAYEIAQQIRAGGDEVRLLAIVDGDAPPSVRRNVRWTPRTLGHFVTNLAWWIVDDVFASSAADVWARLKSKSRNRGADIRFTIGAPGLSVQHLPWLEAYADAISRYRPVRYPGEITLLRARAFGLFQRVEPDRGWSALADRLTVRIIRGNHATIMREPLVRRLAQDLAILLNP
jgi:thioesterase domain-containing protein